MPKCKHVDNYGNRCTNKIPKHLKDLYKCSKCNKFYCPKHKEALPYISVTGHCCTQFEEYKKKWEQDSTKNNLKIIPDKFIDI